MNFGIGGNHTQTTFGGNNKFLGSQNPAQGSAPSQAPSFNPNAMSFAGGASGQTRTFGSIGQQSNNVFPPQSSSNAMFGQPAQENTGKMSFSGNGGLNNPFPANGAPQNSNSGTSPSWLKDVAAGGTGQPAWLQSNNNATGGSLFGQPSQQNTMFGSSSMSGGNFLSNPSPQPTPPPSSVNPNLMQARK